MRRRDMLLHLRDKLLLTSKWGTGVVKSVDPTNLDIITPMGADDRDYYNCALT